MRCSYPYVESESPLTTRGRRNLPHDVTPAGLRLLPSRADEVDHLGRHERVAGAEGEAADHVGQPVRVEERAAHRGGAGERDGHGEQQPPHPTRRDQRDHDAGSRRRGGQRMTGRVGRHRRPGHGGAGTRPVDGRLQRSDRYLAERDRRRPPGQRGPPPGAQQLRGHGHPDGPVDRGAERDVQGSGRGLAGSAVGALDQPIPPVVDALDERARTRPVHQRGDGRSGGQPGQPGSDIGGHAAARHDSSWHRPRRTRAPAPRKCGTRRRACGASTQPRQDGVGRSRRGRCGARG